MNLDIPPPMPARRPSLVALLAARGSALALALLAGCVVVPRTTEVYDPKCRTMARQVVLDVAVVGQFGHCANEGCLAMLVSAGIITAASAVVSGSVAIVGNIAYWLERQGGCPEPPAPPEPPRDGAPRATRS